MSVGLLLSLIGLLSWATAVARGGWAWLLAWVGSAFLLIGVSYVLGTVSVFGKREDGSLPIWRVAVLLPYLLLIWGIWHARRLLGREPPYGELEPGVLIGRRLVRGEWPEGIRTDLDLTSEFFASRPAEDCPAYRCLPILDRCAPDPGELIRCLREVLTAPRPLYLHCAEGHGRAALAAAVLLLLGDAGLDAEQALSRVRSVRSRARLSRAQRAALDSAFDLLQESPKRDGGDRREM
jgi:hypothetical protein